MERFDQRVAFVTGAGNGIGAATAARLHAEGAFVVLADREFDAAAAQAERLAEGRAFAVECDVTVRESVDAAIGETVAAHGRIDALVCVAGASWVHPSPLEDVDDEDWVRQLDLNLVGAVRCIRAAAPHLPRGAAIVLVGSVNGLAAFGEEGYSAAKAGLSVLAKNLAVRLGPQGKRINVVAPGTVRTRVWDQQGGADRLAPMYPLGRVGEPADIAAAIAFLASDDASWITGVTLPVDGGVLAGPQTTMLYLAGDQS